MTARVTFPKAEHGFHQALKARVDGHFAETGRSKFADGRFFAKAAVLFAIQGGLFATILAGGVAGIPGAWLFALCALLGFVIAQVGFNVGHDAIHGAVSKKRWVNQLLSASFDLAGASSTTWATSHNFVHHTYTNMVGIDKDLEPGPYLRFYKRPDVAWLHRFQHVYAWFLYGFTMFVWVFKKDFVQAFERDLRTGKRPPRSVLLKVLASKALHFTVCLAVPMLVLPHAWWQVLLGYALTLFVVGVTLAVVFQLAHCVEGPSFPVVDGEAPTPWAEHQLHTTANFATKSWWALVLTGGLNHQIEHHLFSKISHVHYRELGPLVREVAEDFGLPYHQHPTFAGAVASHYRQMKAFGQPEQLATVPATPTPLELRRHAA